MNILNYLNVYKLFFKRFFDFFIASFAAILLFPIICITSIILTILYKGTPFFFQTRPGKNEKIFKIVKFKTMSDKRDENGNFLPDAERVTTVGNIVRKLSIDELPQLFNVIKGDMSLIGPRPLLIQYLPIYTEQQKKRHQVRPGITGLAQVNGRNAISWNKKFEYDIEYVENISLLLDTKIFFKTIQKVFIREGISKQGQVTTDFFNGKN